VLLDFIRLTLKILELKLAILYIQTIAAKDSFRSCQNLIDYGFNSMNLHSVEAVIVSENYACKSTFENGFIREGLFENLYFQGRF
jgi:hypothetical protein